MPDFLIPLSAVGIAYLFFFARVQHLRRHYPQAPRFHVLISAVSVAVFAGSSLPFLAFDGILGGIFFPPMILGFCVFAGNAFYLEEKWPAGGGGQ